MLCYRTFLIHRISLVVVACLAAQPLKADILSALVKGILKSAERSGAEIVAAGRIGGTVGGIAASGRVSRSILGEELVSSLSPKELSEFERAIDRVIAKHPGRADETIETLQSTLALAHAGPDAFKKTISYDDTLPFLRVRATGNPLQDGILRDLAHARLADQLSERFSVADLRIVPLGMADDAAASAQEAGRYARWLPRAQRDEVGPLAQLARGEFGDLSHREMVALLEPYRGKTIIFVGHIPKGTDSFFAMTSKGPKPVGITDWLSAATDANVNIIPIGCNSGKFASFGASHIVNSDDVLNKLLAVVKNEPKTIQDFLEVLTGENLALVVDPLDVRIFSNAHDIIRRETGERVGRLTTNLGQGGVRLFRSPSTSRPLYDPCFTSSTPHDFQVCVSRVKSDYETNLAEAKERQAQAYRSSRLSRVPVELAALQAKNTEERLSWAARAFIYVLTWLFACFAIPYGYVVRGCELDEGKIGFAVIFNRNLVRLTPRIFIQRAVWFKLNFFQASLILLPSLLGVFALLFEFSEWFPILALLAAIYCLYFAAAFLWAAATQKSLALVLVSAGLALWVGAGWYLYAASEAITASKSEIVRLEAELADLKMDTQNSKWRARAPSPSLERET